MSASVPHRRQARLGDTRRTGSQVTKSGPASGSCTPCTQAPCQGTPDRDRARRVGLRRLGRHRVGVGRRRLRARGRRRPPARASAAASGASGPATQPAQAGYAAASQPSRAVRRRAQLDELARAVHDAAPAQEAVDHVLVALERDRRRRRRAAPRRSAGRRRAGRRGRRRRCSAGAHAGAGRRRAAARRRARARVGVAEVRLPAALACPRAREHRAVGELAVGVAVHRGVERRVDEQLRAHARSRAWRAATAARLPPALSPPTTTRAGSVPSCAAPSAGRPGDRGARVVAPPPGSGCSGARR